MLPLAWLKIGGILLACATALGGLGYFVHKEKAAGAAQCLADGNSKALAATIATQAVSNQRVIAIQGVASVAQSQAVAARADADAARTADEQLRQRLATLGRTRAAHPALAAGGQCDAGADLVPADVFGRIDDAATELGSYADNLRVELGACTGSYAALSTSAK
jgi:hypothetical protein